MRRTRSSLALLPILVGLLVAAIGPSSPVSAGPPPVADKWAVLIGVDNYEGTVRDNVGGVGDVNDLRETLTRSGWAADHIRTLVDGQATGANIRAAWKWLAERTNDNTFSVVHFSGHVKQIAGDGDKDGEDLDEYLWPVDSKFISDREFGNAMAALKGWAWVDFSGCEAAGFNEGVASPHRLFTASSAETEKSYENPDWKNSVFTHYLADLGILGGQADRNNDKRVSIDEAFDFAAQSAPQFTARQSKGPQHPYRSGGDGTEWFLQVPPPAPSTGSAGDGGTGGGGGGANCMVCVPALPPLP